MFDTIAVVGAGTMGTGICEVIAVAKINVISVDPSQEQQDISRVRLKRSVEKGIERGKIEETNSEEILSRITWTDDVQSVKKVPLVIEAVPEIESIKLDLFQQLGELCQSSTLLASNTSSIPITKLAAISGRPRQVIGMHFFNPVPMMKAVEIVRGLETSDETLDTIQKLTLHLGKTPLVVKDMPGFISNRVLMPMINEAIFAFSEGIAEAEVIDQMMTVGCHHPMGPLQLADFIGLDVCLSIMEVMHRQLGDPKFRPAPLLRQMVSAGHLGRKSGRGFYPYSDS